MALHRRRKVQRIGPSCRRGRYKATDCKRGSGIRLALEPLEPRLVLSPIISEFLTSNTDTVNGLRDFENTLQDWIEIHNPDDQPVNLLGWKLKDSGNTWSFPDVTLGPGEFRIVFASGKDRTTPELHTNFSLKRDPGEYLGLLDNLNHVVHEYSPEYPNQEENISYGIGQNIQETKLVPAGADTRYFVATDNSLETTWVQPGFSDASWAHGPTGLGFAALVPGFAVWNYKANVAVTDLGVAQTVINTPSYQTAVYTETAAVVDYLDTGGGGHFTPDSAFPGMPLGTDHNDFVVRAKGIVHVIIFGLLISITNSGASHGLEPLFGLLIAIWYAYMPFEAYHTARKRQMGQSVDEFSSLLPLKSYQTGFPVGPVVLIALGVLFLLNTLDILDFHRVVRYWPVLLIGLGAYMLYCRLTGCDGAPVSSQEARHGQQ